MPAKVSKFKYLGLTSPVNIKLDVKIVQSIKMVESLFNSVNFGVLKLKIQLIYDAKSYIS